MRCAEFETRLNDLLDHRVRPDADESLCRHARKCRPCGNLLYAQELLFEGLSGQSRPDAPSDLSGRVLAELKTGDDVELAAPSATPAWAKNQVLWATAAAVLVAVGLGWYMNGLGRGVNPVPNDGAPPNIAQPAKHGTPNNTGMIASRLEIPQEYINQMRQTIDEVPARVDDVTTGLRPLTVPMEAAINALRNSIPNLHNAG